MARRRRTSDSEEIQRRLDDVLVALGAIRALAGGEVPSEILERLRVELRKKTAPVMASFTICYEIAELASHDKGGVQGRIPRARKQVAKLRGLTDRRVRSAWDDKPTRTAAVKRQAADAERLQPKRFSVTQRANANGIATKRLPPAYDMAAWEGRLRLVDIPQADRDYAANANGIRDSAATIAMPTKPKPKKR